MIKFLSLIFWIVSTFFVPSASKVISSDKTKSDVPDYMPTMYMEFYSLGNGKLTASIRVMNKGGKIPNYNGEAKLYFATRSCSLDKAEMIKVQIRENLAEVNFHTSNVRNLNGKQLKKGDYITVRIVLNNRVFEEFLILDDIKNRVPEKPATGNKSKDLSVTMNGEFQGLGFYQYKAVIHVRSSSTKSYNGLAQVKFATTKKNFKFARAYKDIEISNNRGIVVFESYMVEGVNKFSFKPGDIISAEITVEKKVFVENLTFNGVNSREVYPLIVV